MTWRNLSDHPIIVTIGVIAGLGGIIGLGYTIYDHSIQNSNNKNTSTSSPTTTSLPSTSTQNFVGRVENAKTETNIRGAKITLEVQGVPPVMYSDSEGVFSFPLKISSTPVRIRVEADGYEKFDRLIIPSAKSGMEEIKLVPIQNLPLSKSPSVEKITTEKLGQAASDLTIAGIWRGDWSNPEGYLFSFKAQIEISSNNNVSGAITWKLVASTRSQEQSKVGLSAIEYIGGTYNPNNRLANIAGRSKDDLHNIISLDVYRIDVSEDGQSITGETANGGNWQGKISGKRIVSQSTVKPVNP